jgi:hypothetical protein
MNYRVVLKEEADEDVLKAYLWYESKQQNLGERFLNELEEYLHFLEQDPYVFQIRRKNLHYCPLKRFPYIIVYEIEKQDVVIYAVFNTYQKPSRLKKRKE